MDGTVVCEMGFRPGRAAGSNAENLTPITSVRISQREKGLKSQHLGGAKMIPSWCKIYVCTDHLHSCLQEAREQ